MKQATISSVETLEDGFATRHALGKLTVETPAPGFTELTKPIAAWVADSQIGHGLLTVYCRHTSASLTIQENADPDVLNDLLTVFQRLAPRDGGWIHTTEGPDDMPAHIRTMLTATSLQVPVFAGRLALGTWQGIYLVEHRERPHRREVVMQVIGSKA